MPPALEQAYALQTSADAKSFYRDWAATYDKDLTQKYDYIGPNAIAREFQKSCADRGAKIIDVGCGTGLVGEHLADLGYHNIYGIDLVQAMLDEAAKKGVYKELYCGDLLAELNIAANSFDAAVSMGTFTRNHVGPPGLEAVLRLIRPRGVALISINAAIYQSAGFEQKLHDWISNGLIQMTRCHEVALMTKENVRGLLVEFMKL